jgi:hypothetical protein
MLNRLGFVAALNSMYFPASGVSRLPQEIKIATFIRLRHML